MKLVVFIGLVSCVLFVQGVHHFVLKNGTDPSNIDDDWWKTAVIYQIYPATYKDSDGDGIGDLQGIISKLDHLVDMGVTAVWLSPIYPSPNVDQGYDISNYTDVDKMYGNLTVLKNLVDAAREVGIKIIMDFVPNHSSDQHEWFKNSAANSTNEYSDYYVWLSGTGTDNKTEPNNWISNFGNSSWNYSETRNQFYLHQFSYAQPDLNYSNPNVVAEMKNVLKYWLDVGVAGFRMDAVPYLFEDKEFKDEPRSGTNVSSHEYSYLKHIYTTNLDATYDMIYQFRDVLDTYTTNHGNYSRIMMTEAYTEMAEQAVAYYGNSTKNGAQFTFNFNLIREVTSNFTVDDLITTVNKWLSHLPKKYVSNWVLGNHDNHRVASRFGPENVDAFNMLAAFLPGVQVTYMGEEIGMEDGEVNCTQGRDPQSNCANFNATSRDFERTPYQWDNTTNAGFSTTNGTTWLPVSKKYNTTNLAAQNVTGLKSHYNVYKSMIQFRKNFKNVSYDAVSLIKLSNEVLQIVRTIDKREYIYVFNAGSSSQNATVYTDNVNIEVLVTDVNSHHNEGDVLKNPILLNPHEALLLNTSAVTQSSATTLAATWLSSIFFILLLAKFY